METELCDLCDRGVGHCSNMIGFDNDPDEGDLCVVKCRSCKNTLSFKSRDEGECCGHRYVGEDLWYAEAASGEHDEYGDSEDLGEIGSATPY